MGDAATSLQLARIIMALESWLYENEAPSCATAIETAREQGRRAGWNDAIRRVIRMCRGGQ